MEQQHVSLKNVGNSQPMDIAEARYEEGTVAEDNLIVRINGILPDFSSLGSEEKSERAQEIKRQGIYTNTSCSLYARINPDRQIFHILVDIGEGIINSIKKGPLQLGFDSRVAIPDALLITHSHDDHVKELPTLMSKIIDNNSTRGLKIFCTTECRDQLIEKFPRLFGRSNNSNRISFISVEPGKIFEVGPFSIMPILAHHGDTSPLGSVIYIVKMLDKKIIIGWDFLSLPNADENWLWKPDLLILGTQNYNTHPETGIISVSDAYSIVRRWNAKECYVVHYTGLQDFEEASNQWFRGPVKAMTTEELQKMINGHLQVTGDNGKFRITVAKEGMIWTGKDEQKRRQTYDETTPIGKLLEIESLQKYILKIENLDRDHKLKLMIEDSVNRFNFEFDKPLKDVNSDDVLLGQGVKGMLAKGPQLRMEIIPPQSREAAYAIRIVVFKGKKNLFKDDILLNNNDAQRLKRYIKENFIRNNNQTTMR
ncbi:MAG: MBL fold metallo-hydrolase [Nitrososphaeraceae archaeon]